jgi:hypothetical protein
MALDDYLEPEVAVAVAVTAAVASPTVRKTLRKGVVYGLAGLLVAKDKIAGLASNVAQGVRQTAAESGTTNSTAVPATEATPS